MKILPILLALTGAAALYAQQPAATADPFIKGNAPASPPPPAGDAAALQTRVFHVPTDFLSRGKGVNIDGDPANPFSAPPPEAARRILESLGVSFGAGGAYAEFRGSSLIVKNTADQQDLVEKLVTSMGGGNGELLPAEALVRMEVFSLPHTLARKVQRQFPKSADLYAWLDAELQKPQSEVKLEHLSALKLRGGQRSKLEQIDEYPWPTEFDPPQIPQTVSIGAPLTDHTTIVNQTTPPAPTPAPMPPTPPVPPAPPVKPAGAQGDSGAAGVTAPGQVPPIGSVPASLPQPPWPRTTTTPTSYQTKNLGWTAEIEMTIAEDRETVDFNLAPELVRLTGLQLISPGEIEQPDFETAKISTQLLAKMGRPQFAGTLCRPLSSGVENGNAENRVRLLFFTPIKPTPEIPAPGSIPVDNEVKSGNIHFDLISLPTADARRAMLQHPKEQELYRWLDGEIEKKDSGVVLEQTHSLIVRSGQRSKQESINEYAYPTEFDPAQIPQTISLPVAAASTPAGNGHIYPAWPRTGNTPSAFEVRNLGWTAEVELTFGENGWMVDMNLAPQYVRLVGSVAYGAMRDVVQPVFETQKVSTQMIAVLNQPTFVSTFSPPLNTGAPGGNTKDRVWFLFVTVTRAE